VHAVFYFHSEGCSSSQVQAETEDSLDEVRCEDEVHLADRNTITMNMSEVKNKAQVTPSNLTKHHFVS